jgi:hypothetical protein
MSVLTYEIGALFVYRTIKNLTTNPLDRWANSYEFRAVEAGTDADLIAVALTLLPFEKAFHSNLVNFSEVLISTWEEDSKPYDPETFISYPTTGVGAIGGISELEALNICLTVRRSASSGRFGHLFYRGVLHEGDVEAPAGKATLSDPATMQEDLDAAMTSSGFDSYVGPTLAEGLELVMINKGGTQIRNVRQLVVSGVTMLPTDHAWFNRTST